nr:unnamed protein product [Callosobruchus chinensis]
MWIRPKIISTLIIFSSFFFNCYYFPYFRCRNYSPFTHNP